jgi:hypothetical protein
MLGVTLFGIFLTPVFFYLIQGIKDRRAKKHAKELSHTPADTLAKGSPKPA